MPTEESNKAALLRGIYVVTESACMNSQSGAFRHIEIGIGELGQHFTIVPCLPSIVAKAVSAKELGAGVERHSSPFARSALIGCLRDLRIFLKKCIGATMLGRRLWLSKPDFVYFRASYLDPLPVILKVLAIPCFIESNGLLFESQRMYYPSLIGLIARQFERLTYSCAAHVFFVGDYGSYWNLRAENWGTVENGVEWSFLERFSTPKAASLGCIKLCFVGRLMMHHEPELLIEAIGSLAGQLEIELHLIGASLGPLAAALNSKAAVVEHGYLDRDELAEVLAKMDIGLIPGVPEYQSQMKLFDYGAARLAVVAPDVLYFRKRFGEDVCLFQSGQADSLARTLHVLAKDRSRCVALGNRFHDRIRNEFTWEALFSKKAATIRRVVADRS